MSEDSPAMLAVLEPGDAAEPAAEALAAALAGEGVAWAAAAPGDAGAALSDLLGPLGGDRPSRPVAVAGFGRSGGAAVDAAAADGRVGALVLVGATVPPAATALVSEWPEMPLLAAVDPEDREALRGTVDAFLASAHPESDLRVGPVAPQMAAVARWVAGRLASGAAAVEVSFPSDDGWEVHGTRLLPRRADPAPGVVLLHTGRSDRSVFARLERLLAGAGFAVLNIDWRGRGRTTNQGTYFELSPEARAEAWRDALAAADHLAGRPEVDPGRLAAVGVVHGAEHAARAAVRDERIKALVLLTGYRPATDDEATHLVSGDVEVLYVTSTDHTITTEAMRDLFERSPGRHTQYVEYPGAAIGYQLFEVDHALEARIVSWLSQVLAP